MYATLKGLLACAALAAAAACADGRAEPLLPDADALSAKAAGSLSFSSTPSYGEESPQTASGTVGAIEFTGSLTTPNPCFDVRAAHRTGGSTVTLTVSARASGSGGCIQVITHHNYAGAVSRLAAGDYTFVVVHEVGTSRATVFSAPVTVH